MPRNRVPPPPITQPLIGRAGGRASLAWTKWFNEMAVKSNFLGGLVFLAAKVSFTGRATNGAATILDSDNYNISTMERVSAGVYEGVIAQQTAYGVNLFDDAMPVVTHNINPSATTEAFEVLFSPVDDVTFQLSVFELVQGAGTSVDLVLYDPDETGDTITLAIQTTLTDVLPPA